MTKKELIEALEEYPDDAEIAVYMYGDKSEWLNDITEVVINYDPTTGKTGVVTIYHD